MNHDVRQPPGEVPTLTEVIEEAPPPAAAVVLPLRTPMAWQPPQVHEDVHAIALAAPAPPDEPALPPLSPIDEEALVQEVLAELRQQVDRMVEYRLSEAMEPILARAVEALVQDARIELRDTLHDVVRRSVAQVVSRYRPR